MGCCGGKGKTADEEEGRTQTGIDANLIDVHLMKDLPPPTQEEKEDEGEAEERGQGLSVTIEREEVQDIPDSELRKDREDEIFLFEERGYSYSRPPAAPKSVITILLLGETGSGKSTLVNAIFNYALGVEYNTPYRYTIIKNETQEGHSQAHSQTQEVKVYKVWCEGIQTTLRIIDTPGFGDTRGLQRDEEISDMIRNAIEREEELHAVCFVAAASRPRLTPTQQYIISKVLGSFGSDARDHIYILATFADGKRGPVLDAFKSDSTFPFSEQRCFHFNNSVLYAAGADRTEVTRAFWHMGQQSLKVFFSFLKKNAGRPFYLEQTVDIIQTQRRLNEFIKGVMPQLTIGISKATTLQHIISDVKAKQQLIDETGSYTYSAMVPRVEKQQKKAGTYTTQCLKCSYSCHQECTRPDEEKHLCCVMDAEGMCRVCPKGCSFAEHKNLDYIFVWKTEQVQREYTTEKLAHFAAQSGLSKSGALRQQLEKELKDTCFAARGLLEQIENAYTKLNTLALRPAGLSLRDNLTVLITEENTAKQQGFQDRIAILAALRDGNTSGVPAHLASLVNMLTIRLKS